jgi:hypothetical protein
LLYLYIIYLSYLRSSYIYNITENTMSLIKSFGGFVKNTRTLLVLAKKYYTDIKKNEKLQELDELDQIAKIEELIVENPMSIVINYGEFMCKNNDQIEDTTFYKIDIDDVLISAIQDIWISGDKKTRNLIDSTLNNMIELYIEFEEQSEEVRKFNVADIVADFNRIIKKIGNEMSSLFPTDDVVIRAKKRTSLAIDQFPTWVINEVGMHLFKYYEQIERKDVEFFLENNYDREMAKTVRDNPDTAKLSEYLVPKIKETWRSLDKNKQTIYYGNVFKLLTHYVEFLVVR